MSKKIVFVSIFDLTRLFFAISKGLVAQGHDVYWITTNEYWTDWLCQQGVSRDKILQLIFDQSEFMHGDERQEVFKQLCACEAHAGITINQILMMDQFVRRRRDPQITEFMLLYYAHLKRFLLENDISCIFAEPTNSNELMAYMVAQELDVQYFSARDVRYPSGRMFFNQGYLQGEVFPLEGKGDGVSGVALIEEFAEKRIRPAYFEKNNQKKIISLKKVFNTVSNRMKMKRAYLPNSMTRYSLRERTIFCFRRLLNSFWLKHFCLYDDLTEKKGKIAFYGLHVQPEASIDVLGSYYSDQLKLIKDIRRALPLDTTLVVKEHPNFLGIKPISFFKELKKIPNISLVSHNTSSFDIFEQADIVFTVSGTTAYEAGMLGIPAIVFSPMYFLGLSTVHLCENITELKSLVLKLLSCYKRDLERDSHFMQDLFGNSRPGKWGDPLNEPSVITQENVGKLQDAFSDLLSHDRN